MADETITDANPTVTQTNAAEPVGDKPSTRAPRKKTAPGSKKSGAASAPAATRIAPKPAKAAPIATPPAEHKRNKYTPAQRASILASIEKAIKGGKTTLKAALQQTEVSEQTYYNWKNAAKKAPAPSAGSPSDDLSSLVALEAENLKLRQELAAKLRAENEELRRRLGRT